jgi:serine/threonine protein kinase/predicted Zn-dependent protease
MSLSTSGKTWEEASSPAAVQLARRFESACRESFGRRPDPEDFLPDDPRERSGAWLALLRADLAVRWAAGDRVSVEWYRRRYPDIDDEIAVALLYEEFCLREEAHEEPDPADYYERFPTLASRLRRILDIHGLVGSGGTTASIGNGTPAIPFPEVGQTIAGFYLVEEIGRGAFARVFLARERQLADRLVALKVSKTGSREPQTLARLQHTHLVPVHSYRTDQATGLHLLCMPYFGRVTLSRLLADPAVKTACGGAELIEALDRLGGGKESPAGRSMGREILAQLSFTKAIAWWGARMAEALDHAHSRGVLHRDIKPSNVLVTSDAMPMLLDFNLARESLGEGSDIAAVLGGTLDYMSPEHIQELADGVPGRVDPRSDIFGLGVLLYEAVAGVRPFVVPDGALTAGEVLLRAAAMKRGAPPSLREDHPEVPPEFEAVVRRCLEPDPDDRYGTAADLAADLQAVVDDRPLQCASEPFSSQIVRWARRNRRTLPIAGLAATVLALVTTGLIVRHDARREATLQTKREWEAGLERAAAHDFLVAKIHFDAAAKYSAGWRHLESQNINARGQARLSGEAAKVRANAAQLFAAAESIRFRLLGFGGGLEPAVRDLNAMLKPFYVLENDDWTKRGDMALLDKDDDGRVISARVASEVNELLYMWVVHVDKVEDAKSASQVIPICDRAMVFAKTRGPWEALRARLVARAEGTRYTPVPDNLATEESPVACFEWGALRAREKDYGSAIAWLNRAVERDPSNYWYRFYYGYLYWLRAQQFPLLHPERFEALGRAGASFDVALGLREHSPWVRFNRARVLMTLGAWGKARAEIELALRAHHKLTGAAFDPEFEPQILLERAVIHQDLGAVADARSDYGKVIATSAGSKYSRAARSNLAKLDADAGAPERAAAEYAALVQEDPRDYVARLGQAMVALQLGDPARAEAHLSELLNVNPEPWPQAMACRALARLALGHYAEADDDARRAEQLEPTPAHLRLRTRTLLAAGRINSLQLERPDELLRLPAGGPALRADLLAAANALAAPASGSGVAALHARLNRAILFSALGDDRAESEANRALELARLSARVYLVRARIRRHHGELDAALSDIEEALVVDGKDPALWELRATLKNQLGDARDALADLERARQLGAESTLHVPRALALAMLGDDQSAVREWNLALTFDPDDPRAFLGRARSFIRLRLWDQAVADLERAADWAGDDPALRLRIAQAYTRCVFDRPRQLGHALSFYRRAWDAARFAAASRAAAPVRSGQKQSASSP